MECDKELFFVVLWLDKNERFKKLQLLRNTLIERNVYYVTVYDNELTLVELFEIFKLVKLPSSSLSEGQSLVSKLVTGILYGAIGLDERLDGRLWL